MKNGMPDFDQTAFLSLFLLFFLPHLDLHCTFPPPPLISTATNGSVSKFLAPELVFVWTLGHWHSPNPGQNFPRCPWNAQTHLCHPFASDPDLTARISPADTYGHRLEDYSHIYIYILYKGFHVTHSWMPYLSDILTDWWSCFDMLE